MPRPAPLAELLHRRWALPVLVELAAQGGAKFVTLARALGVSRDTLRATLDALIASGAVRRNPGHGHPMRPEYLLTTAGERLAAAAGPLRDALQTGGLERVGLRKWSLPVAVLVGRGRCRFNEVKHGLPGITSRALSQALESLEGAGLVERSVTPGRPPSTRYALTPQGRRIVPLAEALGAQPDQPPRARSSAKGSS